jgi:hypothetical protein
MVLTAVPQSPGSSRSSCCSTCHSSSRQRPRASGPRRARRPERGGVAGAARDQAARVDGVGVPQHDYDPEADRGAGRHEGHEVPGHGEPCLRVDVPEPRLVRSADPVAGGLYVAPDRGVVDGYEPPTWASRLRGRQACRVTGHAYTAAPILMDLAAFRPGAGRAGGAPPRGAGGGCARASVRAEDPPGVQSEARQPRMRCSSTRSTRLSMRHLTCRTSGSSRTSRPC